MTYSHVQFLMDQMGMSEQSGDPPPSGAANVEAGGLQDDVRLSTGEPIVLILGPGQAATLFDVARRLADYAATPWDYLEAEMRAIQGMSKAVRPIRNFQNQRRTRAQWRESVTGKR